MDNKKFEQLITLITNEDTEQARALFHDIVVEKSREIYESMMDEDVADGMDMNSMNSRSGQVEGLLDEINVEEEGINEEDDELDMDADIEDDGMDDEIELSAEDDGEQPASKNDIMDLDSKLDQLMAEFEQIMSGDAGAEEEFGAEQGAEDFGAGEEAGADEANAEEMMEAIALQNVKGLYGSKIGGDNGQQTKSPVTANSGARGMASKPVSMGNGAESVPTGPKGPSNYGAKGETTVKGAGSFKNAPAQKTQDLTAAPKPTTTQAAGVNTKSPVSESRKSK